MKVKKSARERRRYILLEGNKKQIEKAILDYIGILGWGKANPKFEKDFKGNRMILSVNRKEINNVRAAIELSEKKIKVLKVSGTFKGLGKKNATIFQKRFSLKTTRT